MKKPELGLVSCGLNKKDGKLYSECSFNVKNSFGEVVQNTHEDIFEFEVGIERQIRETEEEFAYAMISPFCERIVEKKLSKKELEKILRRGMQQESVFDKVRAEIVDTGAYEQEIHGKTEFLKGINYCLGVIDKYQAELHDGLPPVTPEHKEERWIPVSEGLPEKSGTYWCTFGETNYAGIDQYITESDAAIFDEPEEFVGWQYRDVIAWMPLPEQPYKPESEDKKCQENQ